MSEDRCNVLLVQPQFVVGSFWNYQATCEMIGAKYPAPPLGLITIAAMLPESWDIRLVDWNTQDLDDADIAWADLVMTGGMLPQQPSTLAVIERCKAQGVPVAVGGPDVTTSPDMYAHADFRVTGEAEGVLEKLVEAWRAGERSGLFNAERFKADVTTTPVPRFDLLNFKDYTQICVQYSRGCPFTCEFCDIIEIYGRVPRTKTTQQMLAELQALYDLGYRGNVDFVDDNLIGNKKAVKAFLPELIAWQKAHKYPFLLSTEASLNLADDPDLLEMMRDAGFFTVFIGIESPDPEILNATRKKQNTRRDIAASIHRIYEAGIFVLAGFIVGFDEEKASVAEPICGLIEDAAIPVSMAGLLFALPETQLTRRLEREGRLHPGHSLAEGDLGDQCTAGLNFDTLRPRAEILRDYRRIIDHIYSPENYVARVRRVVDMLDMSGPNGELTRPRLKKDLSDFARILWHLTVRMPEHRKPYLKLLWYCLRTNPRALNAAIVLYALFVHLGPFSRYVVSEIERQIEEVESGAWQRPKDKPTTGKPWQEPSLEAAQ
ncbi:B12-binding domain-containing radical SAM protein [Breoghania sp.]|uniref:B12-binding domain-containing radical SAM protein n=1 Tax=Breoghania sp. TaxID=2065378 RepID=UPI002AAB76CC|nr:B12-binding domain-containing radical SAM protein [Breoghania sp.]